MKQVIATERIPIKLWLDDIEDGALEQAKNLANLPFVFKHIALMPDVHRGYGMPIGGVMATEGVVVPNAVGVDIGCGVCALKTVLTVNDINRDNLKKIMSLIRQRVPVGYKKHKKPNYDDLPLTDIVDLFEKEWKYIIYKEHNNAAKSLGTLGSGNHFVEIQKDREGIIWIMIHSGSRNLGKKVADYYNGMARGLNQRYYSIVGDKQQLAFLPLDTQEAKDYLFEMQYCVDFALANRKVMMDAVSNCFLEVFDCDFTSENELINIAHNYAAMENHYGRNVLMHRKGATLARENTIGIIPGSQGTNSYIVKGKGNRESFMSCSHGAGRKMGREEAKRTLDLEDEKRFLDEKGIIHSVRHVDDLDEAPGSYKDISVVMENQKDLVEIIAELEPLAVIKE